ncbi:MAG: hypothetical protein ACM359_14425, partial [Bacillota bacterium]
MSEQNNFFSRIGQWFKSPRQDGNVVSEAKAAEAPAVEQVETRLSIFRPWARRDAAIAGLQQAFHSLSDLMGTIRNNLEKQNQRQEEIISHLARIPEALQSIPEAARAQGETLKAIGEQIEQQVDQQSRLNDILSKVTEASADQKELLHSLHQRTQEVNQHNEAIADNLRQVGSAIADMGRSTESSAKVLEQFRESITSRDTDLQKIIERQN